MTDKNLLLLLYTATGILLALLSIPLMRRKIPPNGLYGFRIPKTLNNPDLWYVVNQFSARRMFWIAIAFVAAALGLYFLPGISIDEYAMSCLGVFSLGMVITIVQTVNYLRSL
jgi:nitric oxide reductase large subunit